MVVTICCFFLIVFSTFRFLVMKHEVKDEKKKSTLLLRCQIFRLSKSAWLATWCLPCAVINSVCLFFPLCFVLPGIAVTFQWSRNSNHYFCCPKSYRDKLLLIFVFQWIMYIENIAVLDLDSQYSNQHMILALSWNGFKWREQT